MKKIFSLGVVIVSALLLSACATSDGTDTSFPWLQLAILGASYFLIYRVGVSYGRRTVRAEQMREIRTRAEQERQQLLERVTRETEVQRNRILGEARREKSLVDTGATLVMRRRDNRQMETGNTVDPELYSDFAPLLVIEVRNQRLVGKELPFIFKLTKDGPNRRTIRVAEVTHKFTSGVNQIYPQRDWFTTDVVQEGPYRIHVVIPGDVAYQFARFKVGPLQADLNVRLGTNGVIEYNPGNNPDTGMSIQDVIDMIDK